MWHDFKSDPPHPYNSQAHASEEDPDYCYIIFRYLHGEYRKGLHFMSPRATPFINGVFVDYTSHMATSPYPEDWIVVVQWCHEKDAQGLLKASNTLITRG